MNKLTTPILFLFLLLLIGCNGHENKENADVDFSNEFVDGGFLMPPAFVDDECFYVLALPEYLDEIVSANKHLIEKIRTPSPIRKQRMR